MFTRVLRDNSLKFSSSSGDGSDSSIGSGGSLAQERYVTYVLNASLFFIFLQECAYSTFFYENSFFFFKNIEFTPDMYTRTRTYIPLPLFVRGKTG